MNRDTRTEILHKLHEVIQLADVEDNKSIQSIMYSVLAGIECGEEGKLCDLMQPVNKQMIEYLKVLQQLQTIQKN